MRETHRGGDLGQRAGLGRHALTKRPRGQRHHPTSRRRVLSVSPPPADTRLWQFTGSRLTTYRGDHGTVTGPWTTSKMITTTTGTASGTVIVSPSGLSAGGRDFTAWLRALPASYSTALAGYQAHGRSFRFISTTLTVPPRVLSKDHSGDAVIGLHTSCGSQCQGPFAVIEVLPGGGPGSVQYQGSSGRVISW